MINYLDKVILFLIIVLTITLLSVITVNTINASTYLQRTSSEYESVPLPLSYFKKRKLSVADHLWENGSTIKIFFMNKPDKNFKIDTSIDSRMEAEPLFETYRKNFTNDLVIDAIKDIIINRFQPIVNLKFEFVETKDLSDIRIKFFSDCCSSYSSHGNEAKEIPKDQQTIVLRNFSVDLILNRFGHALGLLYEHRNPKNNTIQWADEKVFNKYYKDKFGYGSEKDLKKYRNDYVSLYDNTQMKTDFDNLSIMMVDIPPELLIEKKEFLPSKNYFLSKKDIEGLNKMYPSTDNTKPLLSPDDFFKKYYTMPQSNPGSNMLVFWLCLSVLVLCMMLVAYRVFSKKQQNANTGNAAETTNLIIDPQDTITNQPETTTPRNRLRRNRLTEIENLKKSIPPNFDPIDPKRISKKTDRLNLEDGLDFDAV